MLYCCILSNAKIYFLSCNYLRILIGSSKTTSTSIWVPWKKQVSTSAIINMNIFIKLFYLLLENVRKMIFHGCNFLHCSGGMPFNKSRCYIHPAFTFKERKEFFLRNMKHNKNVEIVKVKTQTKRDNFSDINHASRSSNIIQTTNSKRRSTILLALLAFLNCISTTQSVTGKRQH